MSKVKPALNILCNFDYASETGFATVAHNIISRLKAHLGARVKFTIVAINYFGEHYWQDDQVNDPAYSGDNRTFVFSAQNNDVDKDPFGRLVFGKLLKEGDYDAIFIINDLGAVVPYMPILEKIYEDKKAEKRKLFKSVYYFPVDCRCFPQILTGLEFFDHLVTYTEYGRREVLRVRPELITKLTVIPHGTNTGDFYELEFDKIMEFRDVFIPDQENKFVITNLNRNQPRKDIPATILSFIELKRLWPFNKKPFLYLHMNPTDPMGYNIPAIMWQTDLVEGEDYKLMPSDLVQKMPPPEFVNNVYNMSDLVLSTTLGEGWGLCLESSSVVLMNDGAKKINEVKIGDYVLGNSGAYHKVIDTTFRNVNDYHKLKVKLLEELSVTKEHPFYVLQNDGSAKWVNVKDVNPGDFVGIRKPLGNGELIGLTIDLTEFIDSEKYCFDNDFIWTKMGFSPSDIKWSYTTISERYGATKTIAEGAKAHINGNKISRSSSVIKLASKMVADGYEPSYPIKVKRHVVITNELLNVFGWYLAEGSTGAGKRIEFDTHVKCFKQMIEVGNVIKNCFGVKFVVEKNGNKKCRLRVASWVLAEFFGNLFGRGAYKKRIPDLFAGCELSLMPLVKGYISGDGCTNESKSHISFSTVSPSLAYQIRNILIANNIFSSIKKYNKKVGNYPLYTCVILRKHLQRYIAATNQLLDFKTKSGRIHTINHYLKETETHFFAIVEKNTVVKNEIDVYDLCVDGSHSFMANGIICHNTATEAMATMTPVVCPLNTSLIEITNNGQRAWTYDTEYPVINTMDCIIRQVGDIYDIAGALMEVAKDLIVDEAKIANKKALAAHEYASKLTWNEVCKNWNDIFRKL